MSEGKRLWINWSWSSKWLRCDAFVKTSMQIQHGAEVAVQFKNIRMLLYTISEVVQNWRPPLWIRFISLVDCMPKVTILLTHAPTVSQTRKMECLSCHHIKLRSEVLFLCQRTYLSFSFRLVFVYLNTEPAACWTWSMLYLIEHLQGVKSSFGLGWWRPDSGGSVRFYLA